MKPVRFGTTSMQQCATCGGSWLSTDVFTALCTDRERQTAVMSAFITAAPPPATALGQVRYRRCAACKQMMNRVNFGRVSGIVIDLCKGHGVWFDPGELQGILGFVANGGLERMRDSEAEFKELSKKAWTAGAGIGSAGASPPTGFAGDTTVHVQLTSSDGGAVPLRRLLAFLLT